MAKRSPSLNNSWAGSKSKQLAYVVRGQTKHKSSYKSEKKVYAKIFNTIEECLHLFEHEKDFNQCINNIISIEKLAHTTFSQTHSVSIFIKYLRIQSYYFSQDYDRAVRNIETLTKRVLTFYKKRNLRKEIANLLMQVHKTWADILTMKGMFHKAARIYRELIDLYSIWRSNDYRNTTEYCIDYKNYEFTEVNILEVKSSWGEALMNSGEIISAIKRFEEAKQHYQESIIVNSELIYINILNQVANWYIRIKKKDKALENFEASMRTLETSSEEVHVDNIIMAKIQSNIASIYLEKEKFVEAIRLYQNSLRLKRQKLPEHHTEVELTYCNLAEAYFRAGEFAEAYTYFDQAYEIAKNLYGKQHKITSKYILNWARMKVKLEEYEDSIKLFEYASKLYQYIEEGVGKQGRVILLKLIEIYLQQRNDAKAEIHLNSLLEALEFCKNNDEKYTLLNDLGNIQKKGGQVHLAIELYKKAIQLVTLGNGHKNRTLRSKPVILINLADAYMEVSNFQNASKYYKHALNLLDDSYPMANLESAKIQLKLASAQKCWNFREESLRNYEQALDILENIPVENEPSLEDLKEKARKDLRMLQNCAGF